MERDAGTGRPEGAGGELTAAVIDARERTGVESGVTGVYRKDRRIGVQLNRVPNGRAEVIHTQRTETGAHEPIGHIATALDEEPFATLCQVAKHRGIHDYRPPDPPRASEREWRGWLGITPDMTAADRYASIATRRGPRRHTPDPADGTAGPLRTSPWRRRTRRST